MRTTSHRWRELYAIEQTQLQVQHRVDGVGRPNGTPRRGPSTQFSPPERRWRSLPPPIVVARFYLWCARAACCPFLARELHALLTASHWMQCSQPVGNRRAKSLAGKSSRMRSSTSAVRSCNGFLGWLCFKSCEKVHAACLVDATGREAPSLQASTTPEG